MSGSIIIPRKRVWRPQGIVKPNPAFAAGLELLASASAGAFDVVTETFGTNTGAATKVGPQGLGFNPLSGTSQGVHWAVPSITATKPFSLLLHVTVTDSNATGPMGLAQVADTTPSSGGPQILVQRNTTQLKIYEPNAAYSLIEAGVMLQGTTHAIVITFDGVGVKRLFRNGAERANAATVYLGANPATRFWVGNGYSASAGCFVYTGAYWSRGLSYDEALALSQDPDLIYAKRRTFVSLPAAGGADFTHSASGGIQFSGAASTTFTRKFATAASGGLQLGGAATTLFSRNFAATSSGGLAFGGAASAVADVGFAVAGSGGLAFGGAATAAFNSRYVAATSGGITFGGAAGAAVSAYYGHGAAGGLSFGGAAVSQVDIGYSATGTGGFTFGGSASATAAYSFAQVSSGGLAFGGTGAASFAASSYAYGGSGGLVFGGSAWSSGPAATKPQESGGGGSKRQDPHPARTRNRRIDASRTAEIYARNQQIVQAIVALVTSGALDAMTAE